MKKILITTLLVVLSTLMLIGCTPEIEALSNSEIFERITTEEWIEGAIEFFNENRVDGTFEVSKLDTGTEPTRFSRIDMWFNFSNVKNFEFGNIEFDITADRDVTVPLGFYYGNRGEGDLLISEQKKFELKKGEKVTVILAFDKNFIVNKNDEWKRFIILFGIEFKQRTEEFKQYVNTKYIISNFKIYGVENTEIQE